MKETRPPFLFGFLAVFSLLSFSFYLEYVKNIYPCPLCELQRITFVLIAFFFLIGTLSHRLRLMRYVTMGFVLLTSMFGTLLATKQVWLQHFPESAGGACGASLTYLLKMLPIHDVILQIFAGSAECTERGWDFLSLDLAEWALISFIGFLCYSVFHLVREWRQTEQ